MKKSEKHLDIVWRDNPEFLKEYYAHIDEYALLAKEIEYILKTSIFNNNIKVASISSRTKTVDSFCEKIHRKAYCDPIKNITDFAGVRIVYLYTEDLFKIRGLIEHEFKIIEVVDKLNNDEDRFGYGALHYLCKLKPGHKGARYDKLKDLICEIQVRTILQDAWAIVAHELSYKNESDIPKQFRRRLNALSGLFEIADAQFELIRKARNDYQSEKIDSIKNNTISLERESLELDNLVAYMSTKFTDREEATESSYSEFLNELKLSGYETLDSLDKDIERSSEALIAYEKENPPYSAELDEPTQYNKIGAARVSLDFANETFFNLNNNPVIITDRRKKMAPFKPLVKL